jgi:hypothetical protein
MPDPIPQPEKSSSTPRRRQISFNCTENLWRLLDNHSLAKHVRSVIDFMKSIDINLPLFLWALSWNIPELVSDLNVAAKRTALMLSDELPGILAHWHRPPQKHGIGIHTKAAYETMNKFALDTVLELVEEEMGDLDNVLHSPQSDLSEEVQRLKHKNQLTKLSKSLPKAIAPLKYAVHFVNSNHAYVLCEFS